MDHEWLSPRDLTDFSFSSKEKAILLDHSPGKQGENLPRILHSQLARHLEALAQRRLCTVKGF